MLKEFSTGTASTRVDAGVSVDCLGEEIWWFFRIARHGGYPENAKDGFCERASPTKMDDD